MRAHRELLERQTIGTAFVVSNAIVRFVLSGTFLIQRPPCPYRVCSDMKEALSWSEERLRLAGVPVPIGLGELR